MDAGNIVALVFFLPVLLVWWAIVIRIVYNIFKIDKGIRDL